jgi:glutathionylspermidine synthase
VRRVRIEPRPDWREKVEACGLTWHTTPEGRPYWDESAYWAFDADEVDRIESATAELYDMVLQAVGRVVDTGALADWGYAPNVRALVEKSWRDRSWQPTFYARFDLAYDGGDLKLLELNGDTPTSLVEAAVAQWWWLQERFPDVDQFNSIHEKLVGALQVYAREARAGRMPSKLHFTSVTPHDEDEGTVGYIAACAAEAGVDPIFVGLEDIGWREKPAGFVDAADRPIEALFKLVPWEWLLADPFGEKLAAEASAGRVRMVEPAWKMIASDKRLLVTLWDMFSGHELLLPATTSRERARSYGEAVKKPARGREGQNVSLLKTAVVGFDEEAREEGTYGDEEFVYQARAELAQADGNWAVLGSWVVNREACGMGVRESDGPITGDTARFVPHVIEG